MIRTAARLQSPLAYAAVGASMMGVPASAIALVGASSSDSSASAIKAKIKRSRIHYGGEVVVVGTAPASEKGQTVTLQYSGSTNGGWREIAAAPIGSGGRFRLVGWLRQSGWVVAATPAQAGAANVSTSSSAGSPKSIPQRVSVEAAIRVRPRAINELSSRSVDLWGRLLPTGPGHRLLLQADRSGRWETVSASRTNRWGSFTFRYRPRGVGSVPLRVRFRGDGTNAAASRRAGSVTVYEPSVASWYYDGGTTGCGFHAVYGVANVSLPCGTQVSFYYRGRVVRAVVDDRGPYVGGRTWDLNQNTAAALGMAGVATVWSSR